MTLRVKMKLEGADDLIRKVNNMAQDKNPLTRAINKTMAEMKTRNNDPTQTPTISGEMRNSFYTRILNPTTGQVGYTKEYAPYVEYGHRQEVGRYVPAIKKRLTKPYVEGRYFFKQNIERQREPFQRDVEEAMNELLKK